MRLFKQFCLVMLGALMMTNALAENKGKPFSAMAVQLTPQGAIQTRVFITAHAIRNEYEQDGNKVIEIIYPDEQKRVLLFPADKAFIEQHAPNYPDRRVSVEDSPCAKLQGTLCKKLGNEVINDIETEKWEFSRVDKGRPVHTLHWIDPVRELPIREFFADGTVVEMSLLGNDTLEKRDVEKWRMQVIGTNRQRAQFLQWYDPELKLVIREEHPDGYVRELRDIKVARLKDSLFTIPKDYVRRTGKTVRQAPAIKPGTAKK